MDITSCLTTAEELVVCGVWNYDEKGMISRCVVDIGGFCFDVLIYLLFIFGWEMFFFDGVLFLWAYPVVFRQSCVQLIDRFGVRVELCDWGT